MLRISITEFVHFHLMARRKIKLQCKNYTVNNSLIPCARNFFSRNIISEMAVKMNVDIGGREEWNDPQEIPDAVQQNNGVERKLSHEISIDKTQKRQISAIVALQTLPVEESMYITFSIDIIYTVMLRISITEFVHFHLMAIRKIKLH
jgi:hypothetical protein